MAANGETGQQRLGLASSCRYGELGMEWFVSEWKGRQAAKGAIRKGWTGGARTGTAGAERTE